MMFGTSLHRSWSTKRITRDIGLKLPTRAVKSIPTTTTSTSTRMVTRDTPTRIRTISWDIRTRNTTTLSTAEITRIVDIVGRTMASMNTTITIMAMAIIITGKVFGGLGA